MTEQEYLDNRLQKQIQWYDTKSQTNQKWFKCLKIIEFISAALIPLLVAYSDECVYIKFIVAGLGALIAIIASLLGLYKYQENWIEYRTTAETLKHHQHLYLTHCAPYDDENRFYKLVEATEGLISKENSNWASYVKKVPKKQDSQ